VKRFLLAALVVGTLSSIGIPRLFSDSLTPSESQIIAHELRCLNETGTVLYIAAHPDDENTQLITYFSRGRNLRTAYLSLTRGDGGQNLLGPEFGDSLGVARTQELLAARKIDGGEQYFTRARDFGYSKDYLQTLNKWNHEEVLADIVRVIRTVRPDIIITRFSPEPSGTHGHHTASAYLANEAFSLSGDPSKFPEQLQTLSPWQARRLFINTGLRNNESNKDSSLIALDAAGKDSDTGESFGSLAARSRAMHKTQGFGGFSANNFNSRHLEYFKLLKGDKAEHDLFDNIDCTWSRVQGAEGLTTAINQIIAAYDPKHTELSVPKLLDVRARLLALEKSPLTENKLTLLDEIITRCLGLKLNVETPSSQVIPGETLRLSYSVSLKTNLQAVTWLSVYYPSLDKKETINQNLSQAKPAELNTFAKIPTGAALSQPYWLESVSAGGMFHVNNEHLIGKPINPPSLPIDCEFEIGGQKIHVLTEPHETKIASNQTKTQAPVIIVAPVSLSFATQTLLVEPSKEKSVEVDIEATRDNVSGELSLSLPRDWVISPKNLSFSLIKKQDHTKVTFTVKAPSVTSIATLTATALVNGVSYNRGRTSIHYSHIPEQILLPVTAIKALSIDLKIKGKTIGYLPGAGDTVSQCLEQMGYTVTQLNSELLTSDKLKTFDTIVIGVRAFNTRNDLDKVIPLLWDYIKAGGTVIDQYNTPNSLKVDQFAPYTLSLSRDLPKYRVTNENGPVIILNPHSPALTYPNQIIADDFKNWVQERGLNFASSWDENHFEAVIACSDVNEPPLKSGLLIAHYGKGVFVYTGLSFFRQLPAGTPGAYRLMANLIALGKN